MGEGFIRLRHAINVVLALPGAALLLVGIKDLGSETLSHRVLAAGAGELDQPTDRKGAGAAGGNLDRDLVGGATDAAGANLEDRGKSFDRRLQDLDRVFAAALTDDREAVVDEALGKALLAVAHHLVDQLLDEAVAVPGVRLDRPNLCCGAAGGLEDFLPQRGGGLFWAGAPAPPRGAPGDL